MVASEARGNAHYLSIIMSRLTKPSVIFRERVVPAYAAYLNNPLSENHANNLAEALNNTVEWTYLYLDEVDPARLDGATSNQQM